MDGLAQPRLRPTESPGEPVKADQEARSTRQQRARPPTDSPLLNGPFRAYLGLLLLVAFSLPLLLPMPAARAALLLLLVWLLGTGLLAWLAWRLPAREEEPDA